tara:strand:+ start:85 stop:330 length:246 start_codon:yes stop_codon:yes gene_type:complete
MARFCRFASEIQRKDEQLKLTSGIAEQMAGPVFVFAVPPASKKLQTDSVHTWYLIVIGCKDIYISDRLDDQNFFSLLSTST